MNFVIKNLAFLVRRLALKNLWYSSSNSFKISSYILLSWNIFQCLIQMNLKIDRLLYKHLLDLYLPLLHIHRLTSNQNFPIEKNHHKMISIIFFFLKSFISDWFSKAWIVEINLPTVYQFARKIFIHDVKDMKVMFIIFLISEIRSIVLIQKRVMNF